MIAVRGFRLPLWIWLLDSLALAVVLAVALVALLVVRRRMVARRSGSFDLSVCRQRRSAADMAGSSASVRTARSRSTGTARSRSPGGRAIGSFAATWRSLSGVTLRAAEAFALDDGDVIVQIKHLSGVQQLAMSPSALTGLLAWLESSPPGRGVNNVV